MQFPKIKICCLIVVTVIFLRCGSCFREYPPESFLNNDQVDLILDGFVNSLNDSTPDWASLGKEDRMGIRNSFSLKYYVRQKNVSNFMITEEHNAFFPNTGAICYIGKIYFTPADTGFSIKSVLEVPTYVDKDSVKATFESLGF
jgi:hypothetical protein